MFFVLGKQVHGHVLTGTLCSGQTGTWPCLNWHSLFWAMRYMVMSQLVLFVLGKQVHGHVLTGTLCSGQMGT